MQTHEVDIESIAFGGEGVARIDGKVCFIPFTAPGDRCLIRVIEDKKQFSRAVCDDILTPSPNRITPKCSVFGKCGGCQYQHLAYSDELKLKENQILETFERVGRLVLTDVTIHPILRCPEPYSYRNRIQIHIKNGLPGFRSAQSSSHIAIDECPVAAPEINRQIRELKEKQGLKDGRHSIQCNSTSGKGFSQINRLMLKTLIDHITKAAQPGGSQLIELYAGSGFFTVPLASLFSSIIAVEWDSRLVDRGRKNSPSNVRWLNISTEDAFRTIESSVANRKDLVIAIDPPRQGVSSQVITDLKNSSARKLIYLSCNPTTLARDLSRLRPNWQLQTITPIDLFPRTSHIECLVTCIRPRS
ncbi:MAG: TRAM domain-containing protein [Verrucomicrobiota bacterium]